MSQSPHPPANVPTRAEGAGRLVGAIVGPLIATAAVAALPLLIPALGVLAATASPAVLVLGSAALGLCAAGGFVAGSRAGARCGRAVAQRRPSSDSSNPGSPRQRSRAVRALAEDLSFALELEALATDSIAFDSVAEAGVVAVEHIAEHVALSDSHPVPRRGGVAARAALAREGIRPEPPKPSPQWPTFGQLL